MIYLDEVMFTHRTVMSREYSNLHMNIEMNPQDNDIKTTAVVAAITKEHGMLGFQTYGKSVDIPKFVHFLQHIKSLLPNQKVAVFMDQLAVHRSNIVKEEMERLDFTAIFNTSYSPEHNPIEHVFSIVKNHFSRVKSNAIVNQSKVPTDQLIAESFNNVQKQQVVNCVDHCLKVLKV
jgi:transposase